MNYVSDNLWVQGSGLVFQDSDKKPSYPRWHDVLNPPKPLPVVTKQDYIEHLKNLKRTV